MIIFNFRIANKREKKKSVEFLLNNNKLQKKLKQKKIKTHTHTQKETKKQQTKKIVKSNNFFLML